MPPPAAPTPLVVLVDDDAALRLALTFSLELDGFRIAGFESGEALLAHGAPADAAVLVIDYKLTGLNGLDTAAVLREAGCVQPLILISGQLKAPARAQAEAMGLRVIEKPLLGDALPNAIWELVGGQASDVLAQGASAAAR